MVTTGKMHFGPFIWNFGTFWGSERDSFAHKVVFWGSLEGSQRSNIAMHWVSDAYPVRLGQLNHNVVFGTNFGAVQDFPRGKKRPIGVELTLGAPPTPPKYLGSPKSHPKYFSDPPCNQYNLFHNLITNYYFQNTRIATETPKMPPKRQKWPKTPKISEMQKVKLLKCDPYSSPMMITDPKICEKPKKTPWNA